MPVTEIYIHLQDLYVQGKLESSVRCGGVTARDKKFFDIYKALEQETSRFKTRTMKVVDVAIRFNTSTREVWNAVKRMEG